MNRTSERAGTRALGDSIATMLDAPVQLAAGLGSGLGFRLPHGCEIPPPCWEPRFAGACHVDLVPGSAATVRVHVTNCGWQRQVVGITATGRLAAIVKLEPTTLIVDVQSQATFRVIVRLPDQLPPGEVLSGALLVRGCLDHFARITVRAADCVSLGCCDLHMQDCPDHVHHWYDHFYCPRPCRNLSRTEQATHG
jgi:hypothetical protein